MSVRVGRHGEVSGDDLTLYLMSEANPNGLPVEEFVAASPGGRWVVYMRHDSLVLHDFMDGTTVDLHDSTLAKGSTPDLPHGGADFDDREERVAYIRKSPEGDRVVVRALVSGHETSFEVKAGLIWRAILTGSGEWLAIAVIEDDTNGNGQLDYPEQRTSRADGPCRGPAMSYSTSGFEGDAWKWLIYRIKGRVREDREVVAWAGNGLLVRADDNSLSWSPAVGSEVSLVPADCAAIVLGLYAAVPSVLVACDTGQDLGPLRIYHPDRSFDLGKKKLISDRGYETGRILEVVHSLEESALVDLATGKLHSRAYKGEQGIDQAAGIVLETTREGVTQIRDLVSGSVQAMSDSANRRVLGRQFGRFSAVRRSNQKTSETDVILVDLATRRIAGTLPSMPIAVQDDGVALVVDEDENGVFHGPMYWVAPKLVDESAN